MSGSKAPVGLDSSFKNIYDHATAPGNVVHTDISAALGSRIIDAWGRPIIIQVPYDSVAGGYNLDYARLVSAGVGQGLGAGNAAINTKIEYDSSVGLPDASDRGDDRVLYLKMPDPYINGNQPCDS